MRQTLNQIVVNELQAEHNEIIEYRRAVASGIEDYEDPVLTDTELTDSLQKVINYLNAKTYDPSNQLDMFNDNFSLTSDMYMNEIQYANDDLISFDDNAYIGNIEVDMNQDIVEHTKEYYDTERNK